MSDLRCLLPAFTAADSPAAAHLLSAIEALPLTTADLLSLDALDVARRLGSTSRSSVLDIKRFVAEVAGALHADLAAAAAAAAPSPPREFITTGDAVLDRLFGGGIPTRCITEFVGESGVGKSQFLLLLTLTVQLPPHRGGLGRPAVYISTEAPLCTARLFQLASALGDSASTDRVFSITCSDLESQDHIVRYQLPVFVARHNVGLVVVDSVAANFRAEFERPAVVMKAADDSGPARMARRGRDLVVLAGTLRALAVKHGLAVVVSNQVSDRFGASLPPSGNAMELDFQMRWFGGWEQEQQQQGAADDSDAKVPALGLVWANQLAARVVLRRSVDGASGENGRCAKVVFAPWARAGEECAFEIVEGGVRALGREREGGGEGEGEGEGGVLE